MKPKQLAQELKISDVEVLRLAIQVGIVGSSFKTIFSPQQVSDIKKQFAKISQHQLPPAPPQDKTPLDEVENAIEQVPEAPLEEPEEKGIVEIRQTELSKAIGASESQQAHILETEFHQAADDGFCEGVVLGLVRAKKKLEGAMIVRDAVYKQNQATRKRLAGLLEDSTGDDFLTNSNPCAKTYAQTAKTGASTNLDVYQALRNLGVNP